MHAGSLGAALEREHHDIDGGIESYTASLEAGSPDTEPLLRAMTALRRHIYLEETFLFPPLKAGGLMMAIFVMVKEHGEIWNRMDALEALLASDADAETLLAACREMLALLEAHNSKEEPVIYEKADDLLGSEATGELKDFLATGTMPSGWRSEKA